ncbi:MAG: hypothetical protein N4A57_02370 [Anaeromicrobium sp.]|jgi:hypothetical protein|uniref:hypothetical protein n=1 Tax=Anaeromicrobium sp. TaxID=1929132 RepID=UPI0025D2B7B6|nr:hypothetical protein [Anaeromicrobium sp.]MCT4593106.1 hypothetical protein [Anaeromicrobium sp.]
MEIGSIIRKKVSVVIRIFHDYTWNPIMNGIEVYFNNMPKKPIKKSGGYYVFTNLEDGIYKVNIKSQIYFNETIEIDTTKLDLLDPIINIRLKTKPNYFLREDSTIIKFKVVDLNKIPINLGIIKAFIDTKNYYEGQILEEVKSGHEKVKVKKFCDAPLPGDILYLKEEEPDKSEYIKVLKEDKGYYLLDSPINYDHKRDLKISRGFITKSDEDGNVIVYFKNLLKSKVNITFHIFHEGHLKEVNAQVVEGNLLNLGIITI